MGTKTILGYRKYYDENYDDIQNVWGFHLIVDLEDCNPSKIRDGEYIKEMVYELCDLIKMKRYGEPILVDFGEDENVSGYTLVQLIETSNITAHFVNKTNRIFFDVFSCKNFEHEKVILYLKEKFDAKKYKFKFFIRG
jgi:S-adenosylmethionine/arginine decarboxylase-like enzyme